MKITLRKANAIQTSIIDAMKSVKLETVAEFNEFQNPAVEIVQLNQDVFAADKRRSDLLLAQFSIRGQVGAANATSGVDAKLTQAAYIDKRIGQLETLSSATAQTDLTIIQGKIEKIRNRKDDTARSLYGREDTVSTGLLSKEQIEATKTLIRDLKKQKQVLNDEILELNVRTEITLTSDVEEILRAEGLV